MAYCNGEDGEGQMMLTEGQTEIAESLDFSADVEEYYSEIETQWLQFFNILESLVNECAHSSAIVKELPTLPTAMQLIAERRFDAYKMSDRLKRQEVKMPEYSNVLQAWTNFYNKLDEETP